MANTSVCAFFFFSSRRRHTRWTGDWSSDVCSSDLIELHLDDLHEVRRLFGKSAKAVDHLRGEGVDRLAVLELAETAVEAHPEVEVRHVGLRNHDRGVDADLRREFLLWSDAAGLQLDNRILEHRLIELESDFLDVPRLLVAEQIARAANIEVVAGELEACTEIVELGQDLQPLLRRFGDRSRRRHGEIGIGPCLRAADAATKLIQLGKSKTVRTIDDEGVRARDVEPALDDRSRQEEVVLAVVEGAHSL